MSGGSIENITKSDSKFKPIFLDHHFLPDMDFNGLCLVKTKKNSTPNKLINLYISYTLGSQLKSLKTDFTLSNCLFGSLKLTKNADLGNYKFKGYGIGFDPRSEFLITDGSYGEIFIFFFGADMSSYVHVDDKGNVF